MYFSHGDDVIGLLSSFAYHSSLDCGRYTNICAERLWIPSNDVLSATINYSANFPEFPFNKTQLACQIDVGRVILKYLSLFTLWIDSKLQQHDVDNPNNPNLEVSSNRQ